MMCNRSRDEERYRNLDQDTFYIDKTAVLETEILRFPSIYIEGAAASGKTTLVRMYLQKHSEIKATVIWMDEALEDIGRFQEGLRELQIEVQSGNGSHWIIFENVPGELDEQIAVEIKRLIRHLPKYNKVILIGREWIPSELLQLFWNREMGNIMQKQLCFSRQETQLLAEKRGAAVNVSNVYEATGGWAGCVDMMLRLGIEDLVQSYEIRTYLQKEIWETLSEEECEVLRRANACPWLSIELCHEVWGIHQAEELLERLERKGLIERIFGEMHWKATPLFARPEETDLRQQRYLGMWYGQHGFMKEMLMYARKDTDDKYWQNIIKEYAVKIPFAGVDYSKVLQWKENDPKVYFMRGMYRYFHQDMEGLRTETAKLRKYMEGNMDADNRTGSWELYQNLRFLDPAVSLDEWLEQFAEVEKSDQSQRFQLHILEWEKMSSLCGLRDVTSLFACTKKEENRKERIWKENLDEDAWIFYRLARLEYYLETRRRSSVPKEDWELLREPKKLPEKFWLNVLYLMERFSSVIEKEVSAEAVCSIRNELIDTELKFEPISAEGKERRRQNAQAIACVYISTWIGQEHLVNWLHYVESWVDTEITEENLAIFYYQAKGYLFLNQYEKAEKSLQRLVPYLQKYRRIHFLAEMLFAFAITEWHLGRHGQALRYVIESFLSNGNSRYVECYAEYGKRGNEIIEAYIDWMQKNSPEGWHRKKKYNYGNVLRMPEEEYLDVVLRRIKKEARQTSDYIEEEQEERLTMMEMIILQDINRGLSNAQICEELNLKMPTVKGHIYNLYKKLNVNNRVQAILKAKERGILA